jgi:hypothetical protein
MTVISNLVREDPPEKVAQASSLRSKDGKLATGRVRPIGGPEALPTLEKYRCPILEAQIANTAPVCASAAQIYS